MAKSIKSKANKAAARLQNRLGILGEIKTTESTTEVYRFPDLDKTGPAPVRTMARMQAEHEELVAERKERHAYFATAASVFSASTTKANKEELDRAIWSLRDIDKTLAIVARDIRRSARAEAEGMRVAALSHQIGDLPETDLADFAGRLVRNYPHAAAAISTASLPVTDSEKENAHVG